MRFQDGCDKDLTSNQLTIMAVERIPVTEGSEVTTISVMPDDNIYF